MDLPLELGPDESRPPLDLDRVIGARDEQQIEDLPLFSPHLPRSTIGPLVPAAPHSPARAVSAMMRR